jgi:hypothetical protein
MGQSTISRPPPDLRVRGTSAPRREHEAYGRDTMACTDGPHVHYIREASFDSPLP